MSMIENLNVIKSKGVEEFLKVQEEKWRCPKCGGVICCHNGLCFFCSFDELKMRKKLFRWKY